MRLTTLAVTGLTAAAAAVFGSVVTKPAVEQWYPTMRKPAFTPPTAVFPIAWTVLYADTAVTTAVAYDALRDQHREAEAKALATALGVNMALNAGWSWVFFGAHKLGAATAVAAALTASSSDLTRRVAAVNGPSGAALAAYPAWCGFATALSAGFWRLNRDRV